MQLASQTQQLQQLQLQLESLMSSHDELSDELVTRDERITELEAGMSRCGNVQLCHVLAAIHQVAQPLLEAKHVLLSVTVSR